MSGARKETNSDHRNPVNRAGSLRQDMAHSLEMKARSRRQSFPYRGTRPGFRALGAEEPTGSKGVVPFGTSSQEVLMLVLGVILVWILP